MSDHNTENDQKPTDDWTNLRDGAPLRLVPGTSVVGDGGEDHGKKRGPAAAELLLSLASGAEFFHCGDTPYATILVEDHRENHPVHGKAFRLWLAALFWRRTGKAAPAQAMQDAINTLAGAALHECEDHAIAVRLAAHGDTIYLDLCNGTWQAVKVTANGREVVSNPPVKFIRRRGMLPLPIPEAGRIEDLRPLINASDDATFILIVAWLVAALRPVGPYPILCVNGEQGSCKSTLCRVLRRLIDPNDADLRSTPRDERDLMIAATNALIVAFDNLSGVPPSLSDSLCRLATGGGFSTRELYSDDEEKIFSGARPVLLNGIEELGTRPDLAERSIAITLPPISDGARKTEKDLWREFEVVRPGVLGALLDAVSAAMRNLSRVTLDNPPRMADFAHWACAAEPLLPWPPGAFLAAYSKNRDAVNESALESSPLGMAITSMMATVQLWNGTAAELLTELEKYSDAKTRDLKLWPRTATAAGNALKRIAPILRKMGVEAHRSRSGRARIITLERLGKEPSPPSPPSPNATGAISKAESGDGSVTPGDDLPLDLPSPQNPHFRRENPPNDGCDGSDGEIPTDSAGDGLNDADLAALADWRTERGGA